MLGFSQLKFKKLLKWFLEAAKKVSPEQSSAITTQVYDLKLSSLQALTPNTELKLSNKRWVEFFYFLFSFSLDIFKSQDTTKRLISPTGRFLCLQRAMQSPAFIMDNYTVYSFAQNIQFSVAGESRRLRLATEAHNSLRLTNPWPSNSRSNWNLGMLIFEEGGKPENPEKNLRSKDENQQQTQPTYDAGSRNGARATLVGSERSHHCAIPDPNHAQKEKRRPKQVNLNLSWSITKDRRG